jgi:dextranase
MNYLFARWRNGTTYSIFSANSSGGWSWDQDLTTLAPGWDPMTGRIELEIPIADASSSGSAAAGSFSYIDVEMAYDNPSTSTWQDDHIMGLHYELASPGQAWSYGSTLGHEIVRLTTHASRYSPGTTVTVNADIINPQAVAESGETLMPAFGHDSTAVDVSASWVNIDTNTNYMHSIETLISDVHANSAVAMSYNLIYAAWAGYGSDGSGVNYQWGLWNDTSCTNQANIALPDPPLATPNLYLFDPGNTSWHDYIFGQEQNANAVYPFDGWQADQFGDIGSFSTCDGTPVNMANESSGFLTNAYSVLGGDLVFNAVGQYGQQQVAGNPDLTFLDTECWPANGQTTYDDLQTTIENNTTWSNNTKSTVLAAYPDQSYANNFSTTNPGFLNTPGVLYEDATIFGSGGDHIELGDVDHMLDTPNYLNENLLMSASLQQSMVSYYNFLTAYEDLLRNGETPSSNVIDLPGGPPASTNGTPGTVWTFARSTSGTDVLQFINMLNLSSADWMDTNATQPAPTVQTNVAVKYYYTSSVAPTSVYVASPDVNGGAAQSLSFTTGSDSGGNDVTFTLPSLDYWDMAWVNY